MYDFLYLNALTVHALFLYTLQDTVEHKCMLKMNDYIRILRFETSHALNYLTISIRKLTFIDNALSNFTKNQ